MGYRQATPARSTNRFRFPGAHLDSSHVSQAQTVELSDSSHRMG